MQRTVQGGNVLLVNRNTLNCAFGGICLIEDQILSVHHLDGINTWVRDILAPESHVVVDELLL